MTTFDNGGPLDQLLEKARELSAEAPEVRRQQVVDFIVGRICNDSSSRMKERVTRLMVERIYDGIFTPAHETVDSEERCQWCGLNDGHHYVGCRALEGKR